MTLSDGSTLTGRLGQTQGGMVGLVVREGARGALIARGELGRRVDAQEARPGTVRGAAIERQIGDQLGLRAAAERA